MFRPIILFDCVVRLYLRLQHVSVDFMVQGEKLAEQNFLVLVLDCGVLFKEQLLNFV